MTTTQNDYSTFLQSKRLVAHQSGLAVSLEDIHPRLFAFQRALVQWALRKGRAALFAECGLGKSFMQLEWARLVHEHSGGDVLILAPLAVASQTTAEGAKLDIVVHPCRSQEDVQPGLNIANYEMLAHFDASHFAGIVLDECFAPDTPIDTPNGPVSIKDIQVGDHIYNASGIDRVSDIHRREVKYAVRITVNGKSIVSSPNHPYFTHRGWIGAQDLIPEDRIMESSQAVRLVRQVIFSGVSLTKESAILRDILFSEMADESTRTSSKSARAGSCSETRQEEERLVCCTVPGSSERARANSGSQPNEQPGVQSKILPNVESDESQTFRAWGQWNGANGSTTDTDGCSWREMDSGVCFVTGKTDSGLSHELQTRLSESRAQNSYRSGWGITSRPQSARSEERCKTDFSRVDSLEILEQGHPELEKLRDADGHIYLYDLGATRHPSFSVNGLLVHNSSILKSYMGKTKRALVDAFAQTPYRLCCTATPAPNDVMEIGNHSEFLGIMPSSEMLMRWFINDTMQNGHYRLKGHAEKDFWQWVSSWAISLRKPSDLGYNDDGFSLPELQITRHYVDVDVTDSVPDGQLFRAPMMSATNLHKEMRITAADRAQAVAELVNASSDTWAVWCHTNYEADELKKRIPCAVEVRGSESLAEKERKITAFSNGQERVIIGKPSMLGFGLNWQHCHKTAFVGLSYSFEDFYQAVRRLYRFGQQYPVDVVIVAAETESPLVVTLERKMRAHMQMSESMVMDSVSLQEDLQLTTYNPQIPMILPTWLVA